MFKQRRSGSLDTVTTRLRIWYSPEVKRFVKYENFGFDQAGKLVPLTRRELLSYQLAQ